MQSIPQTLGKRDPGDPLSACQWVNPGYLSTKLSCSSGGCCKYVWGVCTAYNWYCHNVCKLGCYLGTSCVNGNCQCPSGQFNDNNNCGYCGSSCGQNKKCVLGLCVCANGFYNDSNNCGGCGKKCSNNTFCNPLLSTCVCQSGQLNDSNNCGMCGRVCAKGMTCINGSCAKAH